MLHYAVSGNHIDIVKLLLADERFTEINAKDNVSDDDNVHVCMVPSQVTNYCIGW